MFRHVSRADLIPIRQRPRSSRKLQEDLIRCQLENITGGGSGGSAQGASTMLTVLPEGYTRQARATCWRLSIRRPTMTCTAQQMITVEQAKASHLQAQLNLEIASLAVREYRDGNVQETLKAMEGSIALARSDLSRAVDHLGWTKRMNEKGYSSVATIVSEQHSVSLLDFSLKKQLMSFDLFQRFTQPKTEKTLEEQVMAAQTTLNNEKLRLQRQLDRLALLKKQVDRCTIRAPHDGVLYYVKTRSAADPSPIEEGMVVRQRQELFYLPDLSEMEAQVVLNESIVDRVRPGLRHDPLRSVPNLVLEGHVVSVGEIPKREVAQGGNRETRPMSAFTSASSTSSVSPRGSSRA